MSSLAALTLWSSENPEGVLDVSFELSTLWTLDTSAEIQQILKDFVLAGEDGAFPRVASAPAHSHLKLRGGPFPAGNLLSFELEASAIHGRSWQFLRHMAARNGFDPAALRRIQVCERNGDGRTAFRMPVATFENEEDAYPEPYDRSLFTVDWVDLPASKRRRVLVEFASPLHREDFDLLQRPIERWATLLERGAFTLPVGMPDELDQVMGQTTLFDPYTAEIEVPVYVGWEGGWDVLLNLLEAFSVRALPIVSVELE